MPTGYEHRLPNLGYTALLCTSRYIPPRDAGVSLKMSWVESCASEGAIFAAVPPHSEFRRIAEFRRNVECT